MKSTLFETEFYSVSQCYECDVPGYVILESKMDTGKIHRLQSEAKKELGILLSNIEKAISEVLKPENIYCCKFGEEGSVLHFHVFPRTKEMTSTYLENYPDQKELINGPVLFDWAREFYKIEAGCYSERTSSILKSIRAKLIQA